MFPPLQERVDHPVMRGTQGDHAAVVRERGAAFGQRINMMGMQGAPALTGDTGEETVRRARVRAKVPPRTAVVQGRHLVSPHEMLPTGVDSEPAFVAAFTKFFHQVLHSVRPVCLNVVG